MIKSNVLKQTPYPSEFTDSDKLLYDKLYAESKLVHADIERDTPYIIHFAIIGHIRELNGNLIPLTDEELEDIKEKYRLTTTEFKCEEPADSYIYDKEKNPIYFPDTINENNNIENNSNLIIEEENGPAKG